MTFTLELFAILMLLTVFLNGLHSWCLSTVEMEILVCFKFEYNFYYKLNHYKVSKVLLLRLIYDY